VTIRAMVFQVSAVSADGTTSALCAAEAVFLTAREAPDHTARSMSEDQAVSVSNQWQGPFTFGSYWQLPERLLIRSA